jgi:hypothetical protein
MRLPKEVGHVETVLGDPAAELSTRPAVVGLRAQSPERIRDGGCAFNRLTQLVRGRSVGRFPRSPLTGHVRDVDPEVVEAPEEMAA